MYAFVICINLSIVLLPMCLFNNPVRPRGFRKEFRFFDTAIFIIEAAAIKSNVLNTNLATTHNDFTELSFPD